MENHTLTFYSLAAGLCFSLSMLLIAYAQLQRGTVLVRSAAHAILIFAVAFFLAGYGYLLPWWTTRIGSNLLLLATSVVLYSGFYAYLHEKPVQPDKFGIALLGIALPLFFWWGFIEPDGLMRSIIFSLASAILNGRIARLLLASSRIQGGLPPKLLAALFTFASLWMLGRSIVLLLADPLPAAQQGANPTTWITVFCFNVLISAFTITVLTLERRHSTVIQVAKRLAPKKSAQESDKNNRLLLWTLVAVINLTILAEAGIAYAVIYQRELIQLQTRSRLASQASVEHGEEIIRQADILIRATRELVEKGLPAREIADFLQRLNLARSSVEKIYVIDSDGQLVLPLADRPTTIDSTYRDHVRYHLQNKTDALYVGPVFVGPMTGQAQFHLSRRWAHPDGGFAGVILLPLEPEVFTRLHDQFLITEDATAALISTEDRKIRAHAPPLEHPERYNHPLENTPLWTQLTQSPVSENQNTSLIDARARRFYYQRVGEFPLVMVSSFSAADIHRNTQQSIMPIGMGVFLALGIVVMLATLLASVIRKREEQENFISMLGHELKTPISVIRMTLGQQPIPPESSARINRSIQAMQAVIERCLLADRLSHGLIHAHNEPFDANELLHSVCEESHAVGRIHLNTQPLPKCSGDRQLLRTIVANLIDNAIKYGHPGQPVHLDAEPANRRGRAGLRIRVANPPGPAGFPDPQQVFRKYYRAPAAHGKTGSGLGLHISAGLARMMGGKLTYTPTDTEICFELWIPNP